MTSRYQALFLSGRHTITLQHMLALLKIGQRQQLFVVLIEMLRSLDLQSVGTKIQ